MPITTGSNIASLEARRRLDQSSTTLTSVFERLSSGQRINRASDDAAGLAIATQLNATSRVFTQALRNVTDGISASNIAEGALSALKEASERQLELATQAANGVYSLAQRQAMNSEANALVDEFNRIVQSTTFNGLALFDTNRGATFIQAGAGAGSVLQLNVSDQLARPVGDGTFATAASFQVGGNFAHAVALGDVNGDGKLDAVTADNISGEVTILVGNGDGTFKSARTAATAGSGPSFVSIGDLNGDGKLNLVTADYASSALSVLLGNGDGTFRPAQGYATAGAKPLVTALGDLNGDGRIDIVTADSVGQSVSVLFGNGNGSFTAAQSYHTGGTDPRSVTLGDFNGDGSLDIVATDNTTQNVSLFLNTGRGTFSRAMTFQTGGGNPFSVAVGDVNADGRLDLVTADFVGDTSVFVGNGDGTFQAAKTYQTGGGHPRSVVIADLNGDGRLDLVTADASGSGTSTMIGNGDGSFKMARSFATGGSNPYALALGDLNGDGRLDIVTSDYGGTDISALLGNGPTVSTTPYLNLLTRQGALAGMDTVNQTLGRIQAQLAGIGATTSRFAVALGVLQTSRENFVAASARIMDTDIAQDSAELVRCTILQQGAAAVLSHAAQQPRIALQLLA